MKKTKLIIITILCATTVVVANTLPPFSGDMVLSGFGGAGTGWFLGVLLFD